MELARSNVIAAGLLAFLNQQFMLQRPLLERDLLCGFSLKVSKLFFQNVIVKRHLRPAVGSLASTRVQRSRLTLLDPI